MIVCQEQFHSEQLCIVLCIIFVHVAVEFRVILYIGYF